MEGSLTGLPLPIILRPPSPLTDDELMAFSRRNRPYRIEKSKEGELVIMTPVTTQGGFREDEVSFQLGSWARQNGGGRTSSSSTGFNLQDGSTLSPDTAWTSNSRLEPFKDDEQERYLPVCPEFVIEVRSKSDSLTILRGKMQSWLENGALLAWLIDPFSRTVTVYRPGRDPEELSQPAEVHGEGPVDGFVLITEKLWAQV